MADDGYTFESTKARLEEILVEVKKKDTSLEKSIELLEEGVRLANKCNELIDRTGWEPAPPAEGEGDVAQAGTDEASGEPGAAEGAESAGGPDETTEGTDATLVTVVDTVEVVEGPHGEVEVIETVEVIEEPLETVEGWDETPDDERS
jgi:exodeoxyribonuclease VII small subunit